MAQMNRSLDNKDRYLGNIIYTPPGRNLYPSDKKRGARREKGTGIGTAIGRPPKSGSRNRHEVPSGSSSGVAPSTADDAESKGETQAYTRHQAQDDTEIVMRHRARPRVWHRYRRL